MENYVAEAGVTQGRHPSSTAAHALTFSTPEAFFEAAFGPAQHDAHVRTRHQHQWLEDQRRANREADARVNEAVAEIIVKHRARVAADRRANEAAMRGFKREAA